MRRITCAEARGLTRRGAQRLVAPYTFPPSPKSIDPLHMLPNGKVPIANSPSPSRDYVYNYMLLDVFLS